MALHPAGISALTDFFEILNVLGFLTADNFTKRYINIESPVSQKCPETFHWALQFSVTLQCMGLRPEIARDNNSGQGWAMTTCTNYYPGDDNKNERESPSGLEISPYNSTHY